MGVVKSFQHPKAMGNARAGVRGLMFPIFWYENQQGSVSTPYGLEDVRLGPTATLATLFAVGRLSPVSEETALQDERLKEKEAYWLSWLPLDPATDYSGIVAAAQQYSPLTLALPAGETDPVVVREGQTLFMALRTRSGVIPTNDPLIPLRVISAHENLQAEELEWTALVVRDETAAAIKRGA